MKLLIATGLYPPEIGGPATHARALERYLPQRGIEVSVVPFSRVRRYPKWLSHALYFFLLVKEGRKADGIYALDPVSVGFPAYIASVLLRKRFIVRVAGDRAWESATQYNKTKELLDSFVKNRGGYGARVRTLKWTQSFVAKRAECVVVPSVYLAGIMSEWGVEKSRVRVVYNGLENQIGRGNKRTLRGLLRFSGDIILSAGRLVHWKGFNTLIELMPEILKRHPETKLFIAGDGPDMGALEARTRELNVERSVSFAGALPQDVLAPYIQASDVFVLNTGYEGFSHQILEVMSAGVPVITTAVGGNPELIVHEKSGLLVGYMHKKQLLRAILDVLEKPHLRKKLSDNGVEVALTYTQQRMIDALVPILRKEE